MYTIGTVRAYLICLMGMLLYITMFVGSVMGLSYLPQTWKIIKMRRAEELSLTTYLIIMFGACVWLVYGFSRHDLALIVANLCGIIGSGSVLFATIRYRIP